MIVAIVFTFYIKFLITHTPIQIGLIGVFISTQLPPETGKSLWAMIIHAGCYILIVVCHSYFFMREL